VITLSERTRGFPAEPFHALNAKSSGATPVLIKGDRAGPDFSIIKGLGKPNSLKASRPKYANEKLTGEEAKKCPISKIARS
jgi:hypothetical protein